MKVKLDGFVIVLEAENEEDDFILRHVMAKGTYHYYAETHVAKIF